MKLQDISHTSNRHGGFKFTFKRINVILGANGAGKSKFLAEIKESAPQLTGGAKAVYIEGGRTIKIRDILQLDHSNFLQFERYDSALSFYEGKRATSLADRVFDALLVLDKRDSHIKTTHSDAVERWHMDGMTGAYPCRKQPPLERLFELFNEIFPKITLSYDSGSRRLSAAKGSSTYGPSGLSDGEKQVFSILADLIELEDAHKLIIADEPELNLHPELAERLWTLIENEFPDKRFIYATHSIGFVLRENVEAVYVLGSEDSGITPFSNLESLPRNEVTAFLGAIPGILSANRVLVTEGHDKSFDAIFYRWVLADSKLEIFPGGGCADVAAIAKKTGLWEKVSSRISIMGVVDSDFRSDTELKLLASNEIHVLDLHEAESYLCLPEVLVAVAGRIGSQASLPTIEEVSSTIVGQLGKSKLAIAARRTFARSKLSLAVSIERKILTTIVDESALLSELRRAANEEVKKAAAVSPDDVERILKEELQLIDRTINAADISGCLRLIPAKELLGNLAPRAGCKNGADLMRSLKRNFRPEDFERLGRLSQALVPPAPS